MLLEYQPVVRLRLAPALCASVVFAEIMDVVPVRAPDFFEFSLQVWDLMLVALALLLGDPLEVLALLAEGQELVVRQSSLLLEDVLVDIA